MSWAIDAWDLGEAVMIPAAKIYCILTRSYVFLYALCQLFLLITLAIIIIILQMKILQTDKSQREREMGRD